MKNLEELPKKVLLYFISKNPNIKLVKNKTQKDLVKIIEDMDILCEWSEESYEQCPTIFLKKLCSEKSTIEKNILKNRKLMIEFLLEDKKIETDEIVKRIKECLSEHEQIDFSEEEIRSFL